MSLRWRIQKLGMVGCSKFLHASGMFNSFYGSWRHHFEGFERRGLHVLPVHYYSPVPDTRELKPELWQSNSEMVGVHVEEEKARALLHEFAKLYGTEYNAFPAEAQPGQARYYRNNPAFHFPDAAMLYCFIRSLRPKRMIEIGSGFSTLVAVEALRANRLKDSQYQCDFIAIEPYPPEYLHGAGDGGPRIMRLRLQEVPLDLFASLGTDDILFIDSTHVLRTGSDVQREYLEILPRIASGVVVHIHDIFLPAEYPRDWLIKQRFFWNEQYLLQAFLAFNREFEVLWPAHLMHLKYPQELKAAFQGYTPEELAPAQAPASWWMRRA
jgi:hypothetical protein